MSTCLVRYCVEFPRAWPIQLHFFLLILCMRFVSFCVFSSEYEEDSDNEGVEGAQECGHHNSEDTGGDGTVRGAEAAAATDVHGAGGRQTEVERNDPA